MLSETKETISPLGWWKYTPVFNEIYDWMQENCKGRWKQEYVWCTEHHNILSPYHQAIGIRFDDDADAIFFKLRWS